MMLSTFGGAPVLGLLLRFTAKKKKSENIASEKEKKRNGGGGGGVRGIC